MNIKNNKRRKESIMKIEKAFVGLLQEKELKDISVSEICKLSQINRSTFYANFLDVYDLADKFREKLEKDFSSMFTEDFEKNEQSGALKMFTHIYENQIFYKTYFKLDYDEKNRISIYDANRALKDFDNKNIKYHIEFFRHGINAIIKMWLENGCEETPQEMADILKAEYRGR